MLRTCMDQAPLCGRVSRATWKLAEYMKHSALPVPMGNPDTRPVWVGGDALERGYEPVHGATAYRNTDEMSSVSATSSGT